MLTGRTATSPVRTRRLPARRIPRFDIKMAKLRARYPGRERACPLLGERRARVSETSVGAPTRARRSVASQPRGDRQLLRIPSGVSPCPRLCGNPVRDRVFGPSCHDTATTSMCSSQSCSSNAVSARARGESGNAPGMLAAVFARIRCETRSGRRAANVIATGPAKTWRVQRHPIDCLPVEDDVSRSRTCAPRVSHPRDHGQTILGPDGRTGLRASAASRSRALAADSGSASRPVCSQSLPNVGMYTKGGPCPCVQNARFTPSAAVQY